MYRAQHLVLSFVFYPFVFREKVTFWDSRKLTSWVAPATDYMAKEKNSNNGLLKSGFLDNDIVAILV